MQKKMNEYQKPKVFIASDHGGFEVKKEILLKSKHKNRMEDLGPFIFNPFDDYPDFAFLLAEKVVNTPGSLGILICRSGNGMVIAANKVDGAYASLCFGVEHAKKAREHDNANILCLDADYEGSSPIEIVNAFISAKFEGNQSRHGRRFKKIKDYEAQREQFLLNSNPRVAIRAFIVNKGKILLILNKKDNSFYLPGGKVEIYQSIEETIKRELQEELSMQVNVEIKHLLAVQENVVPSRGKHKFDIIYVCNIDKFEELEGRSDPNHGGDDIFTWRALDSISTEQDKGKIAEMINLAKQRNFIA